MRREGEVVLIYFNEQPGVFARIETIQQDIKRDWYRITLLLLTLPVQPVTWILRESYIDGETFTMDGRPVRLEEVKSISLKNDSEENIVPESKKGPTGSGRVIPFKKNEETNK
jgi:hypothetical protein